MASFFENAIKNLESFGISDVILPFILIFTIVFAVMQKTKVLGDGRKNFNVIIALVLALSVVIPHVLGTYPPEADVVNIMNQALPHLSLILVAILAVMLMMGVWGKELDIAGSSVGGWIMIISIAFVFFIFGSAAGWFNIPNFLGFLNDPEIMSLLVIIIVFGVIISFITKDETSDEKGPVGNMLKGFTDMFKK